MITDQDEFLKEAVADAFPNTHHCFCLWHILRRIPEKLGGIVNVNEKFMEKFNKCYKQLALRSHSPFEKQMSRVYTDAIFKEFQVEVLGVVSCLLQKEREDKGTVIFRVDDFEE